MYPAFMAGATALDMIRTAEACEAPEGMFFCSRSGVLTFLDNDHRGVSPWTSVQATFDDDGSDLGYLDAGQDMDESLITNSLERDQVRPRQADADRHRRGLDRHLLRARARAVRPAADANADVLAMAIRYLANIKDPFTRLRRRAAGHVGRRTCQAVLAASSGTRSRSTGGRSAAARRSRSSPISSRSASRAGPASHCASPSRSATSRCPRPRSRCKRWQAASTRTAALTRR